MKVCIAKNTKSGAVVCDDGHRATWAFTPKFFPHLDQYIYKKSQEFSHQISTDYAQEKQRSGSCCTLTMQARVASIPETRTITVGDQKVTTAIPSRISLMSERGQAELEIAGRGLNNFWFLNIYPCRLSLRAEVSFAEPRYYTDDMVIPIPKRRSHCCEGSLNNEPSTPSRVYWRNYTFAGVVTVVDIPIHFNESVTTAVTPITLPDTVWAQFAYCLDDTYRIRLRAKTTLILEVDNYAFPRSLRQVMSNAEILNEKDYVIKCDDGCQLMCHKSVLAAHSFMLRETLYESSKDVKKCLNLNTFFKNEVEALLKYLYGGDVTGPNSQSDLALRLCMMGHQLEMKLLEEKMISLIVSKPWYWLKATEEGATPIDMWIFALNMKNGQRLMNHVMDLLIMNCNEFMSSKRYLQLAEWNPEAAVELSVLMVDRVMDPC